MKKVVALFLTLSMLILPVMAEVDNMQPQYDSTVGKEIFYANGTDITINKDINGNTVVSWDGGTQIVPETVIVFGGGSGGSSFPTSNITMEDGTVSLIYGGGRSLVEASIANVGVSNVTINGGTILRSLYGGGLIYTTVGTSNVTVNGGRIQAVCGGGVGNTVIDGVAYAAGTEAEPQNSKNRTNIANVLVTGGTIDATPTASGILFGGGQGYSYVGTANLTIIGGDMSKAYVTSGGSNGYTGTANTVVTGGTINIFQTVNRGKMEEATVKIEGGDLLKVYLGGETDPSVSGTITGIDFSIIGGSISNLFAGTSGGTEIVVDKEKYNIVLVDGIVENNTLAGKEIKIEYSFNVVEDNIRVAINDTKELTVSLTTKPAGYEYLFYDVAVVWESEDDTIATVENGTAAGIRKGETVINATFLTTQDVARVEVVDSIWTAILMVVVFIAFIGIGILIGRLL